MMVSKLALGENHRTTQMKNEKEEVKVVGGVVCRWRMK